MVPERCPLHQAQSSIPTMRGEGAEAVLKLLDASDEGVGTGGHRQADVESGPGLATEGPTDRLVGLAKPGCGVRVRLGETREALGEGASRTLR